MLETPTAAPFEINIRSGGGTHLSSADWTITASIQGFESDGFSVKNSFYSPTARLACFRRDAFDQDDLCSALFYSTDQFVFTWTIPAQALFPGDYVFTVIAELTGPAVVEVADDSIGVTIVNSAVPDVAVQFTGLRSGRYTPVDPRVEQRIINPEYSPDNTYVWTVSYGNNRDVITSTTNGQVLIIPPNRLRQGRAYEVSLTATNQLGVSAVALGHFVTQGNLSQVYCSNVTERAPFNKIHLTCYGSASIFLAGPIRYQVRGYLTANFTVGTDPWLPLSGFSTINSWDVFMPYNIQRVTVYAEDQMGAFTTIEVPIPPLVNASVRAGGQTLSNLRGGVANAQRTGDVEALYNIGTALAAVLNGVLRNDTTDFNRRELIRAIIDPDFVSDADAIGIDSALRFVSYLTTRDDFLPDLPQRLLGDIITWIENSIQPIISASDQALSDTLISTLVDVLDRLSSPALADIRDALPLQNYQILVESVIDNFFQTQNPLPSNSRFTYSGPAGNFKILIDTYAPSGINSTFPSSFGGRNGANVTFAIPTSLWQKINQTVTYPVAAVVTDIGFNYFGYFPGVLPGSVLSNLVSLRFFDANGIEIPVSNTSIQVAVVTHNNETGINVLPAFANETLGDWDSAGLVSRGTRVGSIIRGRQDFVFTTTHLTSFTVFQADFVVTPPISELTTLANTDPAYTVTEILIIMAAIGGGILLVVLLWLGVRLADQRTYHPVTNRSSLIRIREKKDVPTEEDYMSPSQSDSSMVSVHLRRPHYDNGLVIYEDEDSVRSHRSEDEGVDEDEPRSDRSGSVASRDKPSRSASPSPSRSRSPSPSRSNKSSPRSSVKSSPRD